LVFAERGNEILRELENMKRYLLTILAAMVMHMPTIAQEKDTANANAGGDTAVSKAEAAPAAPKAESPVKFSAVVDMQVEKGLYDEFFRNAPNRISNTTVSGYRQVVDEFWMRVALKGSYKIQYLEGVFNLRFYPYWTMRRKVYVDPNSGTNPLDLLGYLDVIELNQAYLKVFKDYAPLENLTLKPHLKIGRDGLQNSCSQLFGNYLDQPTGGYGDSRYVNVTGPFKNKKVFANEIEVGFTFNVFDIVGGATSLMIGGNLSNQNFYNAMATQFYQIEDSKLSAGFVRFYQDMYFWKNRFHLGAGFRNYLSVQDSAGSPGYLVNTNYLTAQFAFDAVIMKDVKFYTEMAAQQMSSPAKTTVIVRPINVGITIPTFGVLDTFAFEVENVATTFFSDQSMRDAFAGHTPTRALGWGIVLEKRYFSRCVIDWGLFTGNPTGDMRTTLRLTTLF
jgi:hypothetical protein